MNKPISTAPEIFARADMPLAEDDLRRELFPVWGGKQIWAWGITERQFIRLRQEATRILPDGSTDFDEERWTICRFIECVKDSDDPRTAQPIFSREQDYEWLANRSKEIIEGAVQLSIRLSGESPGTVEVARDFFDRVRHLEDRIRKLEEAAHPVQASTSPGSATAGSA